MIPSPTATYGQLIDFLALLGFVDESVPGSHRAFRHTESGIVILFADAETNAHVRAEDLFSVRRHLIDGGLLDVEKFDQRFPQSLQT